MAALTAFLRRKTIRYETHRRSGGALRRPRVLLPDEEGKVVVVHTSLRLIPCPASSPPRPPPRRVPGPRPPYRVASTSLRAVAAARAATVTAAALQAAAAGALRDRVRVGRPSMPPVRHRLVGVAPRSLSHVAWNGRRAVAGRGAVCRSAGTRLRRHGSDSEGARPRGGGGAGGDGGEDVAGVRISRTLPLRPQRGARDHIQ